jgi:hypothetical protein
VQKPAVVMEQKAFLFAAVIIKQALGDYQSQFGVAAKCHFGGRKPDFIW